MSEIIPGPPEQHSQLCCPHVWKFDKKEHLRSQRESRDGLGGMFGFSWIYQYFADHYTCIRCGLKGIRERRE